MSSQSTPKQVLLPSKKQKKTLWHFSIFQSSHVTIEYYVKSISYTLVTFLPQIFNELSIQFSIFSFSFLAEDLANRTSEKIEVRCGDSPALQVRIDFPVWLPENLSPIWYYPIKRNRSKFLRVNRYF